MRGIKFIRSERIKVLADGVSVHTVFEISAPPTFTGAYSLVRMLDRALGMLEHANARAARVVELRFFGGLQEGDVAEVLWGPRSQSRGIGSPALCGPAPKSREAP